MGSRHRGRFSRVACGALLGLVGWLCAGEAAADNAAQARILFDEGMAAMKVGHYSPDVCAKFAESNRLDPALGTQFYHAECLEKIGRTASAWAMYLDVAEGARTAKLRDHERYSRERAAALSVKLTKILVVVPDEVRAVPGLQILRDGQLVGEAAYGTAVPVDPGRHQVSVSAPGYRRWTSDVEAWGEGATVTATVPKLQPEPEVKPVLPAATTTAPPAMDAGGASAGYWGPQRIAAVNATGLGVVGLAIGIGLGVDAGAKLDASRAYCQRGAGAAPDECTPEAKPLIDGGRAAAAGSTIAFVAGGVLLAGGAVLWLTAPAPKGDSKGKAAAVWVAPALGGLSAGGVF